MKKILSVILIVTVLCSFNVDNKASAYDEVPPIMKTYSLPIDHINLLK